MKELGDICELIVDCEHKTAPTQETGYPSIRTPNIGRGYFLLDGVNRVSAETYRLWTRRAVPQPGDLIMAREAPVGNVAMIPPGLQPCLGQRTLLIRPDKSKADPRYLAYLLVGDEVQATIHAMTNGVTVPHLNMKDVRTLKLPPIPDLPVQRKIASVLGAYDDLIENNRRRIQILERMAQALYREWFVHFRFPGHAKVKRVASPLGPIPQGWKVMNLGDAIELVYGKALKAEDRRGGSVPVYGSSGVVGFHNEWLVKAPGIVVGRKGNVGSVFWSEEDFYPIDTVFFVRSTVPLHYVFHNLKHQTFLNNDAAVPGLNRSAAYMNPFILPDAKTLSAFENFVVPLFGQLRVLHVKNLTLRRTRDLLLPKLISGALDVSKLDLEPV